MEGDIEIYDPFDAKEALGAIWNPDERSHIEGRGSREGVVLVN